MSSWLPKFMVIKSKSYDDLGNAYYAKGSPVLLGEPNLFSTLVKIEVEPQKTEGTNIHLRFCSSNKYWQKSTEDKFIVAVSSKPEEETSKASCTLFEAVKEDESGTTFYLTHVKTGGRVLLDASTKEFYVDDHMSDTGYLTFTNWESLVNLPPHVAFKGDNDKYLQAFHDDHNYLKFKGDDPNDILMGNTNNLLPDGHIQIKSDYWGLYWRRSPNWIWADTPESIKDAIVIGNDVSYWPIKINETTIALRILKLSYYM